MRRRWGYLLAFFVLLGVEVCIGLWVRDDFVRPYVGDMLVTVLLCCLAKGMFPNFAPAIPVFLFAAAVEGLQWLRLTEKLGLEGTVLGIILGSTCDWKDLLCYGLGCLAFALADRCFERNTAHVHGTNKSHLR